MQIREGKTDRVDVMARTNNISGMPTIGNVVT
jgi:hypothetical protein